MTPPLSADAGAAPIATTTDAAVPPEAGASASTDAAASADASAPADAASADAGARADAGANPNPFRLRLAVEGGPSLVDMGNGAGLDHTGGYVRGEVGMEFRPNLGDGVFIQANAGVDLAWLSRGLGMGVNSSINYQGILANGRVGYSLLGGNLRFSGGVDLGAVHVGAPECRDGMSCGAVFSRNPQLLPIDNWGFMVRPEVGIGTLQGALSLYLRGGWMFGVNPSYNVVDGSSLNFGLNPANLEVGLNVDVMALINLFTGGSSASRPASGGSAEAAPRPAAPEAAPETAAPPPALTGIALVRDLRARASTLRTEVTSETDLATSARAAYTAVTGTDEAAIRRRRVQAIEVYNQAQAALEDLSQIGELLTQAQTAAGGLAGSERTDANRIVQEITNWQTEARRLAAQAYRQARQTVEEFDHLSGHGEDIAFNLVDPTPVTGGGTTGRGRRGRRDGTHTDTPHTDAPHTDAPRTDAPRTDAPRTDAPRTDAPRTDAPVSGGDAGAPHTGGDAGAPRTGADAGPPVFIFGGGGDTTGGGSTGGADAGVTRRRPDE